MKKRPVECYKSCRDHQICCIHSVLRATYFWCLLLECDKFLQSLKFSCFGCLHITAEDCIQHTSQLGHLSDSLHTALWPSVRLAAHCSLTICQTRCTLLSGHLSDSLHIALWPTVRLTAHCSLAICPTYCSLYIALWHSVRLVAYRSLLSDTVSNLLPIKTLLSDHGSDSLLIAHCSQTQ